MIESDKEGCFSSTEMTSQDPFQELRSSIMHKRNSKASNELKQVYKRIDKDMSSVMKQA